MMLHRHFSDDPSSNMTTAADLFPNKKEKDAEFVSEIFKPEPDAVPVAVKRGRGRPRKS